MVPSTSMSLYRKYRPQSFADVVGQDAIVVTLEQAAQQSKLAHAFLFAGSRGTGKTSVARILAKIIMIQNIESEKLQKQILQGVEDGTLVDLLEIDAASNRGIDDIRDLLEKIQFSPIVATAKVYIIDEAHMLTKEAFNALLKTLEEPPPYAYFILATTEMHKIPPTIQSRCQCFPFRRIREEDIIRRLQMIADQEHINISRDALRLIAHHVDGSMRDAISLLDQVRSLEKVAVTDVEQRIGTTGHEHIEVLRTALAERNRTVVIETIAKVEEVGVPFDTFLRQMLSLAREELHAAVKENRPTEEHMQMLETLLQVIRDVRSAPVPGLVVETALLALFSNNPKDQPEALVAQKKESHQRSDRNHSSEEKDQMLHGDSQRERATPREETPVEASRKDATVEAPEVTIDSLLSYWPEILKGMSPPSVKMSLKNGRLQSVRDKTVVLSFASAFHRDKVADLEASRRVEEIMGKIFKRQLKIECVLEDEKPGSVTHEDAVNLADAAAEIF